MDKERILKTLFVGAIFIGIVARVIQLVLDYYSLPFLFELIDKAKANKALMNQIGGYKEYAFSYTSANRSKMQFEVYIVGEDSTLAYEGEAAKISERNWKIEQIKSTISAR